MKESDCAVICCSMNTQRERERDKERETERERERERGREREREIYIGHEALRQAHLPIREGSIRINNSNAIKRAA